MRLKTDETVKVKPAEVKCCLCQGYVTPAGYCSECELYPINITPIRFDDRGHHVGVEGWCAQCNAYVLTHMEADSGCWIDTGKMNKRLSLLEVRDLAKAIVLKLSGPGWPEKEVPLRQDFMPRHWKRRGVRQVGETPLGFPIVFPVNMVVDDVQDEEVPF